MADWRQDASKVTFDAKSYTNDMTNERMGQRSSDGLGLTSLDIFDGNMYNVVGINVNEIPTMRTAIRNYVTKVQEKLNELNTLASSEQAVKGAGIQEAIQEYVQTVSNYCQSLTSQLLAFSDKLVKVQEAWEESDANISSKVNAASSDLGGTASKSYTEKY